MLVKVVEVLLKLSVKSVMNVDCYDDLFVDEYGEFECDDDDDDDAIASAARDGGECKYVDDV